MFLFCSVGSGGGGVIKTRPCHKTRNEETIDKLKGMADDLSLGELRQIVQRDATLKLILLLPEKVLDQALSVGKALQDCAESRRSSLEDRGEGYRRS